VKHKKQVTKKQAAEGRPVMCRNCYTPMLKNGDLFVGVSYICERCGLQWQAPQDQNIQSSITGTPQS
jgi:hypothetical protein